MCVCFRVSAVVAVEQQIRSIPVFSWVHLLREREVNIKKDSLMLGQRERWRREPHLPFIYGRTAPPPHSISAKTENSMCMCDSTNKNRHKHIMPWPYTRKKYPNQYRNWLCRSIRADINIICITTIGYDAVVYFPGSTVVWVHCLCATMGRTCHLSSGCGR